MKVKIITMEKSRTIKTFTGKHFDVFNPDPDLICIEDIAQGLSNQCRFAGQVKEFYSVGEHSIWMAERAEKENKLEALLHDGSEAYILDFPKPIKNYFIEYQEVEQNLMKAVAMKFGFSFPISDKVKKLDAEAFEFERANKLNANTFTSMRPEQVRERFMELYEEIMKEQNILITT